MADGEARAWAARPALTAAIGAAAAIAVWRIADRPGLFDGGRDFPVPDAIGAAIAIAATVLVFTLQPVRWWWSIAFAASCAVVGGLILWSNGGPAEALWSWRGTALFLSIAIAAPLFQAARDAGAARFDYREVHAHAWTNVILWFAGWAFCLIVYLLAWLLAALFQLIGIGVLQHLLGSGAFSSLLIGGAVGGGVGLLRERDRLVRMQQRIVMTVLGVLTPVFGAGLLAFLLALPFTGLNTLWDATRQTTPILLNCVIGALILVNAAIGDAAEDEATNPLVRAGALALALSILPIALIAATAVGLRIDQYGLSPDRLWALTAVVVAAVYGVAYLVSLMRLRRGWTAAVRPANLKLAFALAAVAMVLATPLVSFNAMATRDQLARLRAGKVTPDRFDWAALRFDFGAPGAAAVRRLSQDPDQRIAVAAQRATIPSDRYALSAQAAQGKAIDTIDTRVRILPAAAPLPMALKVKLAQPDACGVHPDETCTLLYRPGAGEAITLKGDCGRTDRLADKQGLFTLPECVGTRFRETDGEWVAVESWSRPRIDRATNEKLIAGYAKGAIEVRPVIRRQVFVGDVPVGTAFE